MSGNQWSTMLLSFDLVGEQELSQFALLIFDREGEIRSTYAKEVIREQVQVGEDRPRLAFISELLLDPSSRGQGFGSSALGGLWQQEGFQVSTYGPRLCVEAHRLPTPRTSARSSPAPGGCQAKHAGPSRAAGLAVASRRTRTTSGSWCAHSRTLSSDR